jgi:hypothetical protein
VILLAEALPERWSPSGAVMVLVTPKPMQPVP